MSYIFFFTIPGWIIFAILFLGVGFLGVTVDWIASHWLQISAIVVLISLLFILLFMKKGERLWGISILSVFTGSFATLISCLMEISRRFDAGELLRPICLAFGGGLVVMLIFLLSGLLVMKQIDCDEQDKRNQQIIWNFLIRTPITLIPVYLQITRSFLW